MAVPLEQFVKQLEDSGIIAGDTLKDFIPPKADPKDAEELAFELVSKKKLTKFQADEIAKGKGNCLVLGNYVLMEKIGAGGMGQVFKAEHRRMHRIVAIKVLPPNLTKDEAAIARFEREVTAAAKLSHPNIVTAHDADEAGGFHFLVMEMVDGHDLSALVKKNGPVSAGQAVNYILQAAKGLEFAHKKGIVHRDIKPANLLLDSEGTVKILDMGLARLSFDGDDAPQAELTNTGTVMGTVDYMAPEQAEDTKTADARADIYALGCSLFYLLTGRVTYDGETLIKKVLAHRDKPIPSLRAARPEVSEQLEAVFKKMVAKKIEDRFQTMTEVIAALEGGRFQQGTASARTRQMTHSSADSVVSIDLGQTTLLKDLSSPPTIAGRSETIVTPPTNRNRKKLWIGGSTVGIAMLAVIIVSVKTKDGTLTVEVDQPGATVQVDDKEKVHVSQKDGKETISISVDPGKHRLKVEKDGFEAFGREFEMTWRGTTPIKATLVPLKEKEGVAGVTKPLYFQTPGFDPWAKEVADLLADEQMKAVVKKLMELNPGFDGKCEPDDQGDPTTIESGAVKALYFRTDFVTDVSPIRALKGLERLGCVGSARTKGNLSDLSPLNGMKLKELDCGWNPPLANLNPLKGLALTRFKCGGTRVSNLAPLKGMPLGKLFIEDSPVTDLSALHGMKLTELWMQGTFISDLSPLKGMHLTTLNCEGTRASDFSPLKDMPLKEIYFDFKPERDTAIFRSIETLEMINRKPTAEFWNEVEEQQKGKKP